jgi:predicted ester cyclase
MTPVANKAIALRPVEVFNGRQLDRLEDVLHPKFRGRGISAVVPGGPEVGPGARRKLYQMFLQAIPDARGQVVDVVAEGDKVVLVDRVGGTHRGEFFGSRGTGNHIEWTAIHIYTIRHGKILEDAVRTDSLAIMQQIGLARKAWPAAKQAVAAGIERGDTVFGRRFDIAGDELTGEEAAAILSKVTGREVHYEGFPSDVLRAQSEDMARMFEWFDSLGYAADIKSLRRDFPEVKWHTFEEWARKQDWSVLDQS